MKRILPPSSKMRTITKEKQSSLQLKPPQAPRYVKVLPKYKWTSRTDFCLLEHRVLKNIITVEKPLERSSGQTVALSISDSLCPMAKHQSILGNCFKWKQSQGHSSTHLCADLHGHLPRMGDFMAASTMPTRSCRLLGSCASPDANAASASAWRPRYWRATPCRKYACKNREEMPVTSLLQVTNIPSVGHLTLVYAGLCHLIKVTLVITKKSTIRKTQRHSLVIYFHHVWVPQPLWDLWSAKGGQHLMFMMHNRKGYTTLKSALRTTP